MHADVKGDIYEGLLAKSAQESPKGAGQYFTPRELIKAIVDCVRSGPDDTVCESRLRNGRVPARRPRPCGSRGREHARPRPKGAPSDELRAGLGDRSREPPGSAS